MALAIPVVWSDSHRLHDPGGEIWVGVRTPGTELPARADRIRAALEREGATFVVARAQPDEALHAVHDPELTSFLARAWDDWVAAGLTEDPGQDRVVPYLFPHPDLISDRAPHTAASISARAGQFGYDTMSLIGPGTWEAARAAIDAAVTAADLVADGAPAAYACVRPPGHHATRRAFGGSCYLNNSAAAAARLRSKLGEPVAVIDIDAHHGNGTQSIFYDEPGVLTASVHVDPAAGWFPHYLGFADETGAGDANLNVPVAPGTGDDGWLDAIARAIEWVSVAGARALVVALGVDAGASDPEAPLRVSGDGFHAAGRALGTLGLPTVLVQEGGYDLDTVGQFVQRTLSGLDR